MGNCNLACSGEDACSNITDVWIGPDERGWLLEPNADYVAIQQLVDGTLLLYGMLVPLGCARIWRER